MDGHDVFCLEIMAHLYAIDGICTRWGVPQLVATLILRDPRNANNSVILGARDLEDVIDTIRYLQQAGIKESGPCN
jgi:hypothetical protein